MARHENPSNYANNTESNYLNIHLLSSKKENINENKSETFAFTNQNQNQNSAIASNLNCEECEYESNRKSLIKGVHDKIKDEQCDQCPAAFARKAHLNKHITEEGNPQLNLSRSYLCFYHVTFLFLFYFLYC